MNNMWMNYQVNWNEENGKRCVYVWTQMITETKEQNWTRTSNENHVLIIVISKSHEIKILEMKRKLLSMELRKNRNQKGMFRVQEFY